MKMDKKCKYCDRNATRNHARHDTIELENLCEFHYAEWHPEFVNSEKQWKIKDREMLKSIVEKAKSSPK